ncbi:MAG: methylcobalamin:coenzyme M methyltransferase [Planctomycetes bacterium ADurb.Bin412]|nr:MAG: methylcobalamin:coenzyme M methyltransferase [Planctomycetes bacterium ADurb.Bin412]
MTPKERVLTALSHQQPDVTPCNYMGTPEIDEKLRNQFAADSMDVVLEHLGTDLRFINAAYIGPELKRWEDGRFETYWGWIVKPVVNQAGTYLESACLPLAECQTIRDVENFRWPKVEWFDYERLAGLCERYAEYAIIYGSSGNLDLINGISNARGTEQVILDIATEDPVGMACMEKRFEICYGRSEKALQACAGKVDIFWIGDDYGTQNGLLISPKVWRKLFFPKVKAMCELGHRYGAKVMMHSCGSTRKIWPDLIEAGVDIYDTIQPEAADMDPAELKKEFGDRICFHGTISIQKTLPFGTKEEVIAEVHERIRTVGKNGGFILAPAHNIQPDTPVENILAMYEARKTFRK